MRIHLTHDISHLIKLSFNTPKSTRGLDALLVTTHKNEELIRPFTEEEIKYALDQMERNKAVDPDGFPIEFFQKCWSFIKHDVLEMFKDFHGGRLDIKRLNYGIITLIPKSK
jgi:hypothetical protein